MFGKKLDTLLKQNSLTSVKLSEELKSKFGYTISKESISKYRKGERTPSPEFINLVLQLTNTDGSVLFDNNVRPVKAVPVIGTASCGASNINYLQDENQKVYIMADNWHKDLYSVIACGDSMTPEIENGDIVVIDPLVKPLHGDMVLYSLDGESAIKILVLDKDAYIMQFVPYNITENFKTKTIRLDDEDIINRLICHKVSYIVSTKNNRLARLKMIGR